MVESKKLTKRMIDAAKYGGKNRAAYIIWDSEVSGFGVRIYPSQKKTFILSYRIQGRTKQPTIGSYGIFTLEQARKKAKEWLVDVSNGIDPSKDSDKKKGILTIENFSRKYLDEYAKVQNKKKSWRQDENRINEKVIPLFGKLSLLSFKRTDFEKWFVKFGQEKPYEANRVRVLMHSMYERAREWEVIPQTHPNPLYGIKPFKEQKRDRWINNQEMPRLVNAISEEKNIYMRCIFCLYLLTGVRKEELLSIKWDDIDLNLKHMRLSDTKAGRPFYVRLSDTAVQIFNNIPKLDGNPHVFPGRRRGKHIVNIDDAWHRIRNKSGLSDVRIHDLRRTFGSWLAVSGESLLLIGKLINQSTSYVTERYAHLSNTPLDNAVNSLNYPIESIVKTITTVQKK